MSNAVTFPLNFGGRGYSDSHFVILVTACLLLASALVCCSPYAQSRRQIPEAKTAGQIVNAMKRWLGMTDEQEAKVRPVIEEQVRKRNELIKKYQGQSREEMDSLKYALQDLRISTEKQLQYFLTNEQMIEYGRMQQEEDQRIIKGEMPGEKSQNKPRGRSGNL
jgi:hypothetical protein